MTSAIDYDSLLQLLNASKAEIIADIIETCFKYRHDSIPISIKKEWEKELKSTPSSLDSLIISITSLNHTILSKNSISANDFPSNFHSNLRLLIIDWREISQSNVISPPRLVDVDWRVDVKTSSNLISHMSVPSVIVDLHLQENETTKGILPDERLIQLELDKESLTTLLEGLGKISEQLNSIRK